MEVSVIIPALNEQACIGRTLARVHEQTGPLEVIVVDGGSEDATRDRAQKQATVLTAPRGRARQMNRGAEAATGDAFLFLHADTLLPDDGLDVVRRAFTAPEVVAGTFRLRFDRHTPLLRLYSFCTRLPWIRLCFGDRGLFVRRRTFAAVGGFPEIPLFEDLELARRLQQHGRFRFLPQYVTTAARRFERNGPLRQQLRNAYLWLHYLRGTNPRTLTHLYRYDPEA